MEAPKGSPVDPEKCRAMRGLEQQSGSDGARSRPLWKFSFVQAKRGCTSELNQRREGEQLGGGQEG